MQNDDVDLEALGFHKASTGRVFSQADVDFAKMTGYLEAMKDVQFMIVQEIQETERILKEKRGY